LNCNGIRSPVKVADAIGSHDAKAKERKRKMINTFEEFKKVMEMKPYVKKIVFSAAESKNYYDMQNEYKAMNLKGVKHFNKWNAIQLEIQNRDEFLRSVAEAMPVKEWEGNKNDWKVYASDLLDEEKLNEKEISHSKWKKRNKNIEVSASDLLRSIERYLNGLVEVTDFEMENTAFTLWDGGIFDTLEYPVPIEVNVNNGEMRSYYRLKGVLNEQDEPRVFETLEEAVSFLNDENKTAEIEEIRTDIPKRLIDEVPDMDGGYTLDDTMWSVLHHSTYAIADYCRDAGREDLAEEWEKINV
jgi:hypothetical protein